MKGIPPLWSGSEKKTIETEAEVHHPGFFICHGMVPVSLRHGQFKDVRAQNVPTYRFLLNLPRKKVMMYFCQKGKTNGGAHFAR